MTMKTGAVQSPEKELRFTRAGQALVFFVSAAMLVAVGVTIAATALYRSDHPELPHPAWAVVPVLLAAAAAKLALNLTRHAYVILTPLGLEIFPFFRPAAGMHLVLWQEIHAAETNADETRLTLHHDAAKTSGIHLSLRPIHADRRPLLIKAVTARVALQKSSPE